MAEIFYCSFQSSMMFKEIRFQKIQEIIHNDGEVKVEEFAEKFSVSEMTIRRDLNTMVQKGLIERTHGGAVLAKDRNLLQSPILMRLYEQATKTAFHNLLGLIALINWMCAEKLRILEISMG